MFSFVLYYYFTLKKNQWKSKNKLSYLQLKKLQDTIENAYEHVPYYKTKFKEAELTPNDILSKKDLEKIPITTKTDIINSNLEYTSDEYQEENLYVSKTSGSTGEPFISYFDKHAWSSLKFASKYRARVACGITPFDKFVIIEAIPIEKAKALNKPRSLFDKIIKKKYVSIYDSIESHVLFYQQYKPTAIYGFPSYFVNLILYLQQHSIELSFVKKIFTSSEMLPQSTRTTIEEYFKCSVYDIYGSTETKEISWECKYHEGYHINEDLFYVEVVDDLGKSLNYGEIGTIVITTLENKAMPLLRYSTGDLGTLITKNCSCGRNFAMMKPIHGRIVDYFKLKNGSKISPYELTMCLEDIPGIIQYQILQKNHNLVEVTIRRNENFTKQSKETIISNLKNILGNDVIIKIHFHKESFNKKDKNKMRVVRSLI